MRGKLNTLKREYRSAEGKTADHVTCVIKLGAAGELADYKRKLAFIVSAQMDRVAYPQHSILD